MTTTACAKRFLRILSITSNLQTPIIFVDTQHYLSITLAVLITTHGSNKKNISITKHKLLKKERETNTKYARDIQIEIVFEL